MVPAEQVMELAAGHPQAGAEVEVVHGSRRNEPSVLEVDQVLEDQVGTYFGSP